MESLSEIQTTNTKESQKGNEFQMSADVFYQTHTFSGVSECYHISGVPPDQVWASNVRHLILKYTKGVIQHRVNDPYIGFCQGIHTVNNENELIYINKDYDIKKLSKDMKTTTTFIESTDNTWKPRCVHWSPFTGDLLVGMYSNEPRDDTDDMYDADGTGKVFRYNKSGQLTQTIQYENTELELYRQPNYVTENNNGDVVVSDYESAVVVTDRGGRRRFSYTGHPPGSNLGPLGICTDAMSHILVCCRITETIHVLDKNGKYLFHLLEEKHGISEPRSLSFDVNARHLCVGSSFIENITEHNNLQDEHTPRPHGESLSCSTQAKTVVCSTDIQTDKKTDNN
eukprot:XP_019925261.1 PREDICTED: uncharacterized protein LOC105334143 [Crassostrea gigas]